MARVIDDRCKRAIRAILVVKDRDVDPYVPEEVSAELRRTVLRELNGFAEFVASILESVRDQGVVLNQLWLDKIDELHAALVPPERPAEWNRAEMASRSGPQ